MCSVTSARAGSAARATSPRTLAHPNAYRPHRGAAELRDLDALDSRVAELGIAVTSYWGPRKLEQWRQSHRDEPRKQLLCRLLEDERYPDGRSLNRCVS
jgi:hypothetical protein